MMKRCALFLCLCLLCGCGGSGMKLLDGEWETDLLVEMLKDNHMGGLSVFLTGESSVESLRVTLRLNMNSGKKEFSETLTCGDKIKPVIEKLLADKKMECGKTRTVRFTLVSEAEQRFEIVDGDQDKAVLKLKDDGRLEWTDEKGTTTTFARIPQKKNAGKP
ncbi:hypothetical protein LJC26_01195 [Desulfovibrio sp. OttesenSCG-928-O18]|nr:hypothetical protein [Desulfovibrio sp. OttesenSCG-928-O18]